MVLCSLQWKIYFFQILHWLWFETIHGYFPTSLSVEDTLCPVSRPFAYLGGQYCCRTYKEKSEPNPPCTGLAITIDSQCCENNDYQACPDPPCQTRDDRKCDVPCLYLYFLKGTSLCWQLLPHNSFSSIFISIVVYRKFQHGYLEVWCAFSSRITIKWWIQSHTIITRLEYLHVIQFLFQTAWSPE